MKKLIEKRLEAQGIKPHKELVKEIQAEIKAKGKYLETDELFLQYLQTLLLFKI